MHSVLSKPVQTVWLLRLKKERAWGRSETVLDRRHPISRWYLLPLADQAAGILAPTPLRPWHVTMSGALLAVGAGICLWSGLLPLAALLALAAWFCDRLDGKLARRQGSESPLGAWWDANLDELIDLGLHAILAYWVAATADAAWPWGLFAAFVAGKYLLLHGIETEPLASNSKTTRVDEGPSSSASWLRRLYHLPGNADLRIHLLVLLLAAGWLTAELVLIAIYYNLRWVARYVLVARRLRASAAV